jgi:hypothetical protein
VTTSDSIAATVQNRAFKELLISVITAIGEHGVAAEKILALRPELYEFSYDVRFDRFVDGARGNWQFVCLPERNTAGTLIGRLDLPSGRQKALHVYVPSQCNAQRLQLFVAGGGGQAGSEIDIFGTRIRCVRGQK